MINWKIIAWSGCFFFPKEMTEHGRPPKAVEIRNENEEKEDVHMSWIEKLVSCTNFQITQKLKREQCIIIMMNAVANQSWD